MNKTVALLLTIFFALSVLGCATTQDREKWYLEKYDTIHGSGADQLWYPGT